MSEAPDGLLHARLLDGSGGARDLPWSEVSRWEPAQGCLWLHFDVHEEPAQRWLAEESGLNDIASSALVSLETRPRAVTRGENLLLALRGVNLNPGSQPDDMVSVRIWTDGRRVISGGLRHLQSTQDVLDELDAGNGARDTTQLLVAWVDRITARMSGTVDSLEDQVGELEERTLAGDTRDVRTDTAGLRKQCITLRRYLAPQREAMTRLSGEALGWLDEMNRLRLREINDRLIRHIEDIDAMRERAAMVQEELQTQVAEEMNRRAYVFTVVATIFLPLGFFTGLMGVNVGGMPGVENHAGFWVVVLLCILVMLGLSAFFWRKRWF